VAELNKQPALAQFNKLNKMFTTVLSMVDDISLLNHDFYDYKEVEIDLYNETIEGTLDDYKIVNINEGPLQMNEDMVNELARDKIVKFYPLERQLSILGSVLEKIADQSNIDVEELKEMNDFINEVKRVNKIRKEFYANNSDYDYKTTEELDELIETKYEGSIQAYNGQFTGN